jgi:hypothetical protein
LLASPEALQWRAELAANTAPPGWTEVDDLLLFKGHVLLPAASSLEQAHTMGHEGCEKTLHRFWATFYSPHARQHIREFMICCLVCQKNKTEHLHPAGLLQPLPVPRQIWSDIAMDFIEGFLKVGGKSVILTVADRFSKFTHFIPLSHPYSANSVAKALFDHNSSYQTALHATPFEVVYGRQPPALLHYEPGSSRVAAVDVFLGQIWERLLLSQDVMKKQHDKKHRVVQFQEGDWV